MSDILHDDLPFLTAARPLRRRSARWRMPTLCLWFSLAEGVAAFALGMAVTLLLPDEVPLGAGGLAAAASALILARSSQLAGMRRLHIRISAGQIVVATAAGGAVLALRGIAWETDLAWAGVEILAAGPLLVLLRTGLAGLVALMLADGRLATHIAVVGDGPAAARAMTRLQATDPRQVHVVGQYAPLQDAMPGAGGARGNLRTLLSDCRLGVADAIVLAVEPGDAEGLRRVQAALRSCIQPIYLAAELMAAAPEDAPVFAVGTIPLMLVGEPPIRGWPAVLKLVLDQIGALLLLAAMAPLLLLVAAAIRLDSPGPILFRQLRVGYNNRLFYMFKFRSMYDGATDRLAKQQTVRGDTRVTRIGRIIRRWSVDELPQLLNVVRAEMSLVGPRPHAPGTSVSGRRIHTLVEDYDCRHRVRPGITGLAQLRGQRGGLHDRDQVADRLASDLEYIRIWSPWLDVKILVGTLALELRGSRGS